MSVFRFGKGLLGNFEQGSLREYLVGNGKGSFSAGAINGNLGRKFHGLLVASLNPPMDRYLTLHKAEETLNGTPLATYRVRQGDHEQIGRGYRYLDSFTQDPFPTWRYSVAGAVLEKQLFMPWGEDKVVLRYRLLKSVHATNTLKLDLFFHRREAGQMDLHLGADGQAPARIDLTDAGLQIHCDDTPAINLRTNGQLRLVPLDGEDETDFEGRPLEEVFRRNIAYEVEQGEQGDHRLDASWRFAEAELSLAEGEEMWLVAGFDALDAVDVAALHQAECARLASLRRQTHASDRLLQDLAQAADSLIVQRPSVDGMTILAGYPWFGDWGRDTMIALPGLTLTTGRFDDARAILETFAKYCNEGMLPNKFPDYADEPLRYNTIDASLWYFWAIQEYLKHTGDLDFVRQALWPTLKSIIQFHLEGTRYGIRVDDDGLVTGGDSNTQLTWMDVKYKGWAVTPRFGKAVEINALWYNALCFMAELAGEFGESREGYLAQAALVEKHFLPTFWNADAGCLYDYVADGQANADIRPNQIFAVSLPYSLLDDQHARAVVDVVWQQLWTPHGLRSLSPDNPAYQGRYYGPLHKRDACYHQGTVWGWLMGHFVDGWQRVYGQADYTPALVSGLVDHFYQEAGILGISEVFDGDAPHAARGCFNQAWSVAEVLRVLVRYR